MEETKRGLTFWVQTVEQTKSGMRIERGLNASTLDGLIRLEIEVYIEDQDETASISLDADSARSLQEWLGFVLEG